MSGRQRAWGVLALAAILAAGAWVVGFATAVELVPAAVPVPADTRAPDNFGVFDEVWGIVRDEFYGERPAPETVTFDAVRGLLEGIGDPYAELVPEAELAKASAEEPPQIVSGVGVWVDRVPEGALVVAAVPDSPGQRAGLVAGDRIVEVDGERVDGLERPELLDRLSGAAGTSVDLTVVHPDGEVVPLEVVRALMDNPTVEVRNLGDGVGYLRIAYFGGNVVAEVDAALRDIEAQGINRLVLDLRDDPGAEASRLRAVASRFVTGPLWLEKGDSGTSTTVTSDAPADAPHAPADVVVLVNEGTASAAEVLAALLHESRGAPLVGARTFGKSTVQGLLRLSDGSLMRLTVAEWTTPQGLSAKGGLEPDKAAATRDDQLRVAEDLARSDAQAAGG